MTLRIHSGSESRTWHVNQDGRGTYRLRYQLAEDGCRESQFSLAKSLLNVQSNCFEERFTNSELAVYWLVEAAKKGHKEAFGLLNECYKTGTGITLQNRFSVERCLHLTEIEKLSSRVAYCINRAVMSDTEEAVAEETFQERVQIILNQEKETEPTNDSAVPTPTLKTSSTEPEKVEGERKGTKCVTASEVVASVQQCLEGNFPLVALKRVIHPEEYSKWFSLKYVKLLWSVLCRSLEVFVEDLSAATLPCVILVIAMLLWGFAYLAVPASQLYFIVAKYRLFFVCLFLILTMLSTTCYIIFINLGFYNVNKWLDLVKVFEPAVKSDKVKKRYLAKTALPFLIFFATSVVYVFLYPLNPKKLPCSDICIISTFLMILVDRTVNSERYLVSISLALNMLLCLYKANILGMLSYGWFDVLNFDVWFHLCKNYQLHFSCISCLTLPLVLPYLYVKMALGNQRKGWQLVLLPHLMSVTWMNLASNQLQESQMSELFWSVVFFLSVLILSKLIGAIASLAALSGIKYLILSNNWSFIGVLLLIFLFLSAWFLTSYMLRSLKESQRFKVCALLMCLTVFIFVFQKPPSTYVTTDVASPVLSWDQYQTYCHRYAWYRTNTAEVEIACLPLKGKSITFEGTVTAIDVIHVENRLQHLASVLPMPFYDWFVNAFGEPYCDCSKSNLSPSEKERCRLYQTVNLQGFHLHNWDVYKFEIVVEISTRTSPEIHVIADHTCSDFIKMLKEGDSVNIIGILEDYIGSSSPRVWMKHATCSSCYENPVCELSALTTQSDYGRSLKHFITFYLSPLFQYVEE